MRIHSSLAFVVLIGLAFAACNSTDRSSSSLPPAVNKSNPKALPQDATHADGVRRITVPELKDLIAKHQVVVVDVRNQPAFDQGHIQGAKLIPTTEVANRAGELPKDKTIVTYCS